MEQNNEEIKEEKYTQAQETKSKSYKNEHVDRLQKKMNEMDVNQRKKVFVSVVTAIFILIIVKLCIGIVSSQSYETTEIASKDSVKLYDSLEVVANKLLDYEFKPESKKSPALEKMLDDLVEEDRNEAKDKAKADSILESKKK
ncbi:MAG: hypothetical protein II623_00545 [Paludibacteraceae bacterium]|nr:hypothetical protein [Paludibacteraceae bacterium]MBR6042149.1 hypothetical protein [Paludibacteraceae bacterium]